MEACWAHNPEVRGSKPRSAKYFSSFCPWYPYWSVGVVVITSALHAEGRQFDPGTDHCLLCFDIADQSFNMSGWPSGLRRQTQGLSLVPR